MKGERCASKATSALWASVWGRVDNLSVSLQRCLIQVAFQPVLPKEIIYKEASQILNKEIETKPVVREVF